MAAVPAPSYVGTSVIAFTATATVTVPFPAGWLPGDILFGNFVITLTNTVSNANGFTIPVTATESGAGVIVIGFVYQITDSDLGATGRPITLAHADTQSGAVFLIRNTSPSELYGDCQYTPISAAGTGTAMTPGGCTTTHANSYVAIASAYGNNQGAITPATGFTADSNDTSNFTSEQSRIIAASGATGAFTFTTTNAIGICFHVTWAFSPNTVGIRLYFDSTTSPVITPGAFGAGWNATGSAVTKNLVATAGSTALTNVAPTVATATNPYDTCGIQAVYGPIGAGSIGGFVRGVMLMLESNAAANFITQGIIRRVDSGGVQQATWLTFTSETGTTPTSSEWPTSTATNRIMPRPADARTLSADTSTNGDYMVVELGFRKLNTSATSRTGTLRYGDNAASDLALNETSTTDLRSWIQIDNGLPVYVAPGAASIVTLALMGV